MSITDDDIKLKRRAWFFAFFILLVSHSTFAEDLVRIRVKRGLKTVRIKGAGLSFQSKEAFSPYQTVALPQFSVAEISMTPVKNKNSQWQVRFPSSGKKDLSIFTQRLVVKGEMLHVGLDPVPSKLYLYPGKNRRIDVVAELDIDNYLAGVLPSEMPASWPMNALKAQVVASRSYMRNIMNSRKAKNYHLEATIHDQVYKAMNLIGANEKHRQKIVRAIIDTQGYYLVNKKKQVYRAFYHADCGGETEEPLHVWGMKQKNGTVKDPFCPQSPSSRWTLEITKPDLTHSLRQALGIVKEEALLKALLVTQRSASGRIAEIAVIFEGEPIRHLSSQEFRRILGFNRLKSANFSFQWFGDTIKISGKGHGHGVGLCQWGARSLAQSGYSWRQILKRYYPLARLEKKQRFSPSLLKVPGFPAFDGSMTKNRTPSKETAL